MNKIYDHIKSNLELKMIWSLAYSSKKISKSCVRSFKIDEVLVKVSEINDLKLNFISRFLVGIVKIYCLKYRVIYEDFSAIFYAKKATHRKKTFKALPLKPISLGPKTEEQPQKEVKSDLQNEIPIGEDTANEVMIPSLSSADNFEPSYSHIEEVRGSSIQNATATQIDIKENKRKKSFLDARIEYDAAFFNKKVKDLKEILKKEESFRGKNLFNVLGIQPEIIKALSDCKVNVENQSIEVARGQSMSDIYPDIGYTDSNINDSFSESIDNLFSIHNLPKRFNFQLVTRDFSLKDKSKAFIALLNFATDSIVEVQQDVFYGPIECAFV